MDQAKPVSTSMATSSRLSLTGSPKFLDHTLYSSIIGNLQYLSLTQPDVAFAINKVCHFMHSPKLLHWKVVKRLLCYLKHTAHYGLTIWPSSTTKLHAFSNTNQANCSDNRHSTSGYCVFFGFNLILGVQRSNPLLHVLAWKHNTRLVLIPLPNSYGYSLF